MSFGKKTLISQNYFIEIIFQTFREVVTIKMEKNTIQKNVIFEALPHENLRQICLQIVKVDSLEIAWIFQQM